MSDFSDIMSNIIKVLSIFLFVICWFFNIKNIICNKCASVKTVKAEVFDKYKPNIVSKYPGVSKQEGYIVVFKTKDKKLSFNISEFSYDNYRIKEKGTLKYKGRKIISFK